MKKLFIILLVLVSMLGQAQVPDFPSVPQRNLNDQRLWYMIDSIRDFVNPVDSAINYLNTYWDDLRVPLTNTKLSPAKSEPVFEDVGNGVYAYGFDADADSTEALHFIAQLPHGYVVGTDLKPHIHWSPETTNTGNVVWKLYWRMFAFGDTLMAVDSLRVVDPGDGVALKHQIAEFSTIVGDSLGLSSVILGNVVRCGEATDDTYTGTAYGVEIDFHYQFNAPGSDDEYVK